MDNFFDGSQELIGKCGKAEIYKYQGYAYKVFKPEYPAEYIASGKDLQDKANKLGLGGIKYYGTEDSKIVKMDLIEGVTLDKKLKGAIDESLAIVADMQRKVHGVGVEGTDIPKLIDCLNPGLLDKERDRIIPLIGKLSEKADSCVCNMNIHFFNILIKDDGTEPGLIDWCSMRVAPPVLDYAFTEVRIHEYAPELVSLYRKVIASDMEGLGITEDDYAAAIAVCSILRAGEKRLG